MSVYFGSLSHAQLPVNQAAEVSSASTYPSETCHQASVHVEATSKALLPSGRATSMPREGEGERGKAGGRKGAKQAATSARKGALNRGVRWFEQTQLIARVCIVVFSACSWFFMPVPLKE